MKIKFGRKFAEFHYDKSEPKIVIEKFLDNISEDWKIFFCSGKPAMIQVNKWIKLTGNYTGHQQTVRL